MAGITIYIADDHQLIRQGLMRLVKEFRRVSKVKEAANGKILLELVKAEQPDVVILDLSMPVMSGMVACEKLAHHFPEVKIVIVSMYDQQGNILKLIDAGAHAFLNKDSDPHELEAAIYSVFDKGIYRNQKMLDSLKGEMPAKRGGSLFFKTPDPILSDRENAILKLICQELTTRQIAIQLGLSENTVRNHRVRIMRKASVKNLPGLVKFAVENGYSV
jgi:two-component system, NarL family, response regulator DegU